MLLGLMAKDIGFWVSASGSRMLGLVVSNREQLCSWGLLFRCLVPIVQGLASTVLGLGVGAGAPAGVQGQCRAFQ